MKEEEDEATQERGKRTYTCFLCTAGKSRLGIWEGGCAPRSFLEKQGQSKKRGKSYLPHLKDHAIEEGREVMTIKWGGSPLNVK